jgi:hypothetical protein
VGRRGGEEEEEERGGERKEEEEKGEEVGEDAQPLQQGMTPQTGQEPPVRHN